MKRFLILSITLILGAVAHAQSRNFSTAYVYFAQDKHFHKTARCPMYDSTCVVMEYKAARKRGVHCQYCESMEYDSNIAQSEKTVISMVQPRESRDIPENASYMVKAGKLMKQSAKMQYGAIGVYAAGAIGTVALAKSDHDKAALGIGITTGVIGTALQIVSIAKKYKSGVTLTYAGSSLKVQF